MDPFAAVHQARNCVRLAEDATDRTERERYLKSAKLWLEHRAQRAWTAWKYAMQEAGLPLPTQSTSGRARCFCGATIDIAVTDRHVHDAHIDSRHA